MVSHNDSSQATVNVAIHRPHTFNDDNFHNLYDNAFSLSFLFDYYYRNIILQSVTFRLPLAFIRRKKDTYAIAVCLVLYHFMKFTNGCHFRIQVVSAQITILITMLIFRFLYKQFRFDVF